jgi:hypothetical protein
VLRDGALVTLKPLPDNPPINYEFEGDNPTNAQRMAIGRLSRALEQHYYPIASAAPTIVRPKPIAPGARIARLSFDDGEIWELDAVEYLSKVIDAHSRNEKRLREHLDTGRAHRARGSLERAKRKRAQIVGDCEDLARALRDGGHQLERWLTECRVPKAKWRTFKPSNIAAAIARKRGLTPRAVQLALKKARSSQA